MAQSRYYIVQIIDDNGRIIMQHYTLKLDVAIRSVASHQLEHRDGVIRVANNADKEVI